VTRRAAQVALAEALGIAVGVLCAEVVRTHAWTIVTPHSREALLAISVLAAALWGSVALVTGFAGSMLLQCARVAAPSQILCAALAVPTGVLLVPLDRYASGLQTSLIVMFLSVAAMIIQYAAAQAGRKASSP
jgi:hypothetical protein